MMSRLSGYASGVRPGWRTTLRESFVPVLGVFALLWAALAGLRILAEMHSRQPTLVRIGPEESFDSIANRSPIQARPEPGAGPSEDTVGEVPRSPHPGNEQDEEAELAAVQVGQPASLELRRALELASRDSTDQALDSIAELLRENPNRGSAWFARGSILSRRGDHQAALEAYARAVEVSAGRAKAMPLYNLGCLHREMGNVGEAIRSFEAALDRRPDYREARLNLALLLADQPERRSEARRLLDQLVRLTPSYAEAWYNRGLILLAVGQADSARQDFERTVQLDSTFAKAWFNLGLLYGRSGRTTDSEHAYRRVIAADSLHLRARLNLAVLLAGNPTRRSEARQIYDDLIRFSPGYAAAYYNRGVFDLEDGHTDAARADFERAVAADSMLANAWFNLGRLYARAGNDTHSVEAFRHAVAADSNHVRSRLNLAVGLARLGRLSDAETAYREILARDPQHAGAWYNLAITLARQGEVREAERLYSRVLELQPDHPQAWQNLGVLYARRRKSAKAIQCYREALALAPDNQAARYNLALEYRRQGRQDDALDQALRLIRLNPDHAKARKLIDSMQARVSDSVHPGGSAPAAPSEEEQDVP